MRNGGPLVVSLRRRLTVGSMTAFGLLDLVVAGGVGCCATSWVRAIEGTSGFRVIVDPMINLTVCRLSNETGHSCGRK